MVSDNPRNPLAYLFRTLFALLMLVCIGTAGFRLLEGFSLLDSLYMTVITVTTVGFGEVHTLSPAGRLFTILLILGGVGVAAYTVTASANYLVSGQWREHWDVRRRRTMLASLKNHVIVCGFGRVGRFVAQDLKAEGISFVILEKDPAIVELTHRFGYLALQGNAANEGLLEQAGILHARGLVAALNSDAENVYITLTARGMNPDLNIIARANFEESESKLLRAGANRVLLPYSLSGRRMVTMLLRPEIADFLDEVSHIGGMELLLEQVTVGKASQLEGLTLAEAKIRLQLNVSILIYRDPGSTTNLRPSPETRFAEGMQVFAFGTRDDLQHLMKLVSGS
ncbi:MAG: potassium channel family protein [Anaerolineales bacterium]